MLDTKGLVALWREGLGAQKALLYLKQGRQLGYQNHPQLQRFKDSGNSLGTITAYMHGVYEESMARGYKFNASLLLDVPYVEARSIPVTSGQVEYEHRWLQEKIAIRSPEQRYRVQELHLHPVFHLVDGDIESWEKLPTKER